MLCFTNVIRRTSTIHTVLAPFTAHATAHKLPRVIPRFSFLVVQSSVDLSRRGFRDLAPKPGTVQPPSATKYHPVAKELDNPNYVTPKEQRRNDWNVVTKLMMNVWPRNDWKTRGTVLLGFGLLVSGKVGKR